MILGFPSQSVAKDPICEVPLPYEAPPYVAPVEAPPESRLHLKDNGDGTLTDPDSGLMWARADSYADLGKCLNFKDSQKYVKNLQTGGHTDWRLPTVRELASIYDDTKESASSWDHNPAYPLALDEKFADGAAYWYWSGEAGQSEFTEGCVRTVYFVKGLVHLRQQDQCLNGGVRAVRSVHAGK